MTLLDLADPLEGLIVGDDGLLEALMGAQQVPLAEIGLELIRPLACQAVELGQGQIDLVEPVQLLGDAQTNQPSEGRVRRDGPIGRNRRLASVLLLQDFAQQDPGHREIGRQAQGHLQGDQRQVLRLLLIQQRSEVEEHLGHAGSRVGNRRDDRPALFGPRDERLNQADASALLDELSVDLQGALGLAAPLVKAADDPSETQIGAARRLKCLFISRGCRLGIAAHLADQPQMNVVQELDAAVRGDRLQAEPRRVEILLTGGDPGTHQRPDEGAQPMLRQGLQSSVRVLPAARVDIRDR